MLSSIPLIATITESMRQNYTVKTVVTLGCHCLISYAKFRRIRRLLTFDL